LAKATEAARYPRADMSERTSSPAVPRRDAGGRVLRLTELSGVSLAYLVLNAVGLGLIDGLVVVLSDQKFGSSSGWLMVILPGLLFFDDFRGWRAYRVRYLVAIVSALVAIGLGLVAAGLVSGLPPMASGGVGATVAVLTYAPLWFLGIRWRTGDRPEAT
jgi:hypothetical protein